jgi:hypothetical protein
MKVKLLKKVRKRYKITIVTSVSNKSADFFYRRAKSRFGLPFFVFYDNEDRFGIRTSAFGNISDATREVVDRVRQDYTKIVRPEKTKETKVWYT